MVLFLDEFEAWVTIDGQKVEEYQCTKTDSVLQCFIPSEAGKVHEIPTYIDNTSDYLSIDIPSALERQ